jgi:HK97 family phage prohead protease
MKMDRKIRQARSLQTQFRASENDGEKYIEGYFATFGGVYELWPGATESVDPHAFDETLAEDIRALIDHETRLVLGRNKAGTLELKVDARGLWARIKLNQADQDAMNLYARVQRGDVDQCSFGFDIMEEDTEYREGGTVHWTIKRVKLYEISCVTFPAYEDTSIAARKRDYEQIRKRQAEVWRTKMKERLSKWHSDN